MNNDRAISRALQTKEQRRQELKEELIRARKQRSFKRQTEQRIRNWEREEHPIRERYKTYQTYRTSIQQQVSLPKPTTSKPSSSIKKYKKIRTPYTGFWRL